jgi:hypothetical protein
LLIGGFIDLNSDSAGYSIEAERRIGSQFKLTLEARGQSDLGENDIFAQANEDEDFIRLRLGFYF